VQSKIKKLVLKSEFLSFFLITVFCVIFSVMNPVFFSPLNLSNLIMASAVPAMFACAVMMVLISGGIDLSFMWIGMFAAYSTSMIFSLQQINNGLIVPIIVIFLVCIAFGAVLGSFNGLLVSKLKVPIFVVTLSTANIFMGVMFQFVGHNYIFPSDMPVSMINFSNTRVLGWYAPGSTMIIGGIHASVFVATAVVLIIHFLMKYTTLGRSIYALGGDVSSAERVGLNLTRVRSLLFIIAGAVAGLTGAVGVANVQVANPFDFQGRELTVIAAVVIGGTRITGGKGSVLGVVLGVLLTTILSQNLILIGVRPQYNQLVFGLLILVAIIVQAIQEKTRNRGGGISL